MTRDMDNCGIVARLVFDECSGVARTIVMILVSCIQLLSIPSANIRY